MIEWRHHWTHVAIHCCLEQTCPLALLLYYCGLKSTILSEFLLKNSFGKINYHLIYMLNLQRGEQAVKKSTVLTV